MVEQCKFMLIGKFSLGSPTFRTLQTKFAGFGFKEAVFIRLFNIKHVMIKFSNKEDFLRLWTRQIVHIDCFPIRIFKWTTSFNPKIESSIIPIWIILSELPLHLFDKKALFSIVALIGKPLHIDEPTVDRTQPSIARVCVELDLKKPLHEIYISCGIHVFLQRVIFEKLPNYYLICRHLSRSTNTYFNEEYKRKLAA